MGSKEKKEVIIMLVCVNFFTFCGCGGSISGSSDGETDPNIEFCCEERSWANYALHEWGVMVVTDGGGSIHGPSPVRSYTSVEKSVIYLYGETGGFYPYIGIKIDFKSGGPIETWPPSSPHVSSPLSIVWSAIQIFNYSSCETTPFPTPEQTNPDEQLCEACALDSSVVEDASCLSVYPAYPASLGGEEFTTKLLFYRGNLPDYVPPLTGQVSMAGERQMSVSITNNSDSSVEDVWVISRYTEDICLDPSTCPVVKADIAFTFFEEIAGSSGVTTELNLEHVEAEVDENGFPVSELPLPEGWTNLGSELKLRLIERGLNEKEAEALLNNWEGVFFGLMGRDSYFSEPLYSNGAFVIYFMSREEYDEQLTLTAGGAEEVVRVGVVYQSIELTAKEY